MLVLGIESASDQCGCALAGAEGVVAEARLALPRRHAEALAPQMRFVCEQAGVALGDVEAVAVDCGPGLYTGLRAGLATAKATAAALGVGVVPVGSLEALALGAAALAPPVSGVRGQAGAGPGAGSGAGVRSAAAQPGTTVLSVLDARRGEVFWASYRHVAALDDHAAGAAADPAHESGSRVAAGLGTVGTDSAGGLSDSIADAAARAPAREQDVDAGSGSGAGSTAPAAGLVQLTDPAVGAPADLRAAIISRSGQAAGDVLLVGDGALRYADVLAVGGAVFAGPELRFPSPAAVALLGRKRALAGGAVPPAEVEPRYLRAPDVQPPTRLPPAPQ